MKFKVLAVRDRAIDAFGQPMFSPNVGGAVRAFGDEVKRAAEGNQLNKHPEDFDLYIIGDFDDATGELIPQRPEQVAIGKDYSAS